MPHAPPAHVGSLLAPEPQTFEHAPQFVTDVCVSTHDVPHGDVPLGHAPTQPVGEHSAVGATHLTLQDPQFAGADRSASQPVAGSPSQSARPCAHVSGTHLPATHLAVAVSGSEHGMHAAEPQPNCGSLFFTHAPLHVVSSAAHPASARMIAAPSSTTAPLSSSTT